MTKLRVSLDTMNTTGLSRCQTLSAPLPRPM